MTRTRTQKYDRLEIYKHDHGICQVCGRKIWKIEEKYKLDSLDFYECGHIVDWFLTRDDSEENLLAMCRVCNQNKPVHETREEFINWVKNGYWVEEFCIEHPQYRILPKEILLEALTICHIKLHFTNCNDLPLPKSSLTWEQEREIHKANVLQGISA